MEIFLKQHAVMSTNYVTKNRKENRHCVKTIIYVESDSKFYAIAHYFSQFPWKT